MQAITDLLFHHSTPEAFLSTIWDAQYGPHWSSDNVERFWQRDLAAMQEHHATIFDPAVTIPRAREAVCGLLRAIGADKHIGQAGGLYVPRAWLFVFHRLYEAGAISGVTWSIAARAIYMVSGPGATGTTSNTEALPVLRTADPYLIMTPEEALAFRRLPPIVTLYRGSCAADLMAAWQGVSWTHDPDAAVSYAKVRTVERYDAGETGGWPRLIVGRIPRAAIMALFHDELWVDYERLTFANFRELNAVADDDVEAVRADCLAQVAASRASREAHGYAGVLNF